MLRFDNTSINKTKLIDRRQFILSAAKLIVFTGIIARLFSLQISQNKKYITLSDKNRLREWKLAPKRGIIEDYFGNRIAGNNQVFQLHLLSEDMVDSNLLFFRLKKIISISDKKIEIIKRKIKDTKPWEPVIISENLSWSEFSRLNLFLHELPGVKPIVSVARNYPLKDAFSHTVGYVSNVSVKDLERSKLIREVHVPGLKIGKNGLEKYLNNELIGSAGYQRYEVNAYGKKIKEIEFVDGEVGKNFKTTLDSEVQSYATELMREKSGSICVMDIYSGDIVASVSSPSFDPNLFVHGISQKEWDKLLNDHKKPLINKSISSLYPPGSTIKPLVALSALEFDVINPKMTVKCEGHIELYGVKFHCWKEKGHGYMGLRNAIKQSCDIYFYEVARLLGVDRLSQTAKKFGLGSTVFKNFDEEKKGIVPNTKWKFKTLGKGWVLGETLISGIGQGYYQSTPIQICLMTAQLANGGYKIKPRIIFQSNNNDEKSIIENISNFFERKNKFQFQKILGFDRDIFSEYVLFRNPENVKFVNEAMFGATNEPMGTSFQSRHTDKKYMFAGKTGTSQIRRITEEQREKKIKYEDLPYEQRDHALFTAFAPYNKPRYAITVVIEHGGSGSSAAAPVASKLIKKIIDRHQLRTLQNKILSGEV